VDVNLKLVRAIERYVIGEDDAGVERWFPKTTTHRIDGDRLYVTVSEASWKRRQKRDAPPKKATVSRRCINCRTPFSAEKNQYVCTPCKTSGAWKTGASQFDG
jgi:hypothetical protein